MASCRSAIAGSDDNNIPTTIASKPEVIFRFEHFMAFLRWFSQMSNDIFAIAEHAHAAPTAACLA
jgi:hypothetical protein